MFKRDVFTVRPATLTDMDDIHRIHAFYVQKTVTTFTLVPKTEQELVQIFEGIVESGLPSLVAEDNETKQVMGFAYASPFRGSKGGYLHTAELSLFVDRKQRGKEIGGTLLSDIITVLKIPKKYPECYFGGHGEPTKIRTLLACMAFDVNGPEKDYGVRLWVFYENRGFVFSGHLKNVGYKFDRWYVHARFNMMQC